MSEQQWRLEELAEEVGVSARTIRYYVQRGLLPAPVFRGRDTVYGTEHRTRLRAIKRLQERFLPLEAIQIELDRASPDELLRLAGERGSRSSPPIAPLVPPSVPAVRIRTDAPRTLDRNAHTRWERWELLEGMELHIAEDASEATRALAEAVRAYVARHAGSAGSKR